jgi:hypothetical protein
VKEALAVSDQVLQVAQLRPVDRRERDLRHDTFSQRKPKPARRGVGRTDRRFVAVRPTWTHARCAERFPLHAFSVAAAFRPREEVPLTR